MAHGYLGEGYGKNGMRDPDDGRRNDERGDWRDRDRSRDDDDRGRFMFEGSNRDRDDDRGFFSRTADETRDWFRDDEHDYRTSRQQPRRERFSVRKPPQLGRGQVTPSEIGRVVLHSG